jgi:hypothetical protein
MQALHPRGLRRPAGRDRDADAGSGAALTDPAFLAALVSGGDRRLALDPRSGLNRYLCPPLPADLACFASCTASPIAPAGLQAAWACYRDVGRPGSGRRERLEAVQGAIEQGLLAYVGATRLARALLVPSGTDAVLVTAALLGLEGGTRPITAILPAASETGSGVLRAAAFCRAEGAPLLDWPVSTVAIPWRAPDGTPREDAALNDAYAAAVAAAPGRAIVYLTHGSKTGLVAPLAVPAGAEVVVDACQGRLAPAAIRRYLLQGFPVIVTGSKFFGGPAFCGAVLFPNSRLGACLHRRWQAFLPPALAGGEDAPALGTLLRWSAALPMLQGHTVAGPAAAATLGRLAQQAAAALADVPAVRLVPGPSAAMLHAGGWPNSIVTFALRDPRDDRRLLTRDELLPLYRRLAQLGVLLGQPVDLGPHGGLRLAIGARDVIAGDISAGLVRLQAALHDVTG